MSNEAPDVVFNEMGKQAESMSNEEMDNFFKEAQQDEANYREEPITDDQGESHEQQREELQRREDATEGDEGRELERDAAESSGEDGREEYLDKQVQTDGPSSDERHQQSYKVALKEERQLRQQMQQELQEQREAAKKMSEAFSKLVEAADPSKQQPPIPSFEEDPIGHLNAKLEMANQRIEGLSKTEQQIIRDRTEQQESQQFMSRYQAKAAEFARLQPDFVPAYQHLVKELHQDYMAQGLTETEANQRLLRDELALADQQMKSNRNPAEVMYELAKRRGYVPANAQRADQPKDDLRKKVDNLERMERGIKASRSINSKGVSPNSRLTLEEIADLNDDDFDKVDWNQVLQMG